MNKLKMFKGTLCIINKVIFAWKNDDKNMDELYHFLGFVWSISDEETISEFIRTRKTFSKNKEEFVKHSLSHIELNKNKYKNYLDADNLHIIAKNFKNDAWSIETFSILMYKLINALNDFETVGMKYFAPYIHVRKWEIIQRHLNFKKILIEKRARMYALEHKSMAINLTDEEAKELESLQLNFKYSVYLYDANDEALEDLKNGN